METKIFRPSQSSVIIKAVKGISLTLLIAVIALQTRFVKDYALFMPLTIIVSAIAIAFVIYNTFMKNALTITVSEERTIVSKKDKEIHNFDNSETYFSNQIIRHYFNGIPNGTDLYLEVETEGGQQAKIYCNMLGKKQFNEMCNYLDQVSHHHTIQNGGEELTQMLQTGDFEDASFTIENKSNVSLITLFLSVVGIVALFGGMKVLLPKIDRVIAGDFIIIFFVTIILIVAVALFVIVKNRRAFRKMPHIIRTTDTGISFDDKVVTWESIKHITLTPPGYTQGNYKSGNAREVKIDFNDGQTRIWHFGKCGDKKNYDAYCSFISELELRFSNSREVIEIKRI